MGELTLSLTVSLIFELALLTAEYKNDPKFFAPCVTFVVTIGKESQKKQKKPTFLDWKECERKKWKIENRNEVGFRFRQFTTNAPSVF